MMLCIVIYYKQPAISDNKHELIQVVVAANLTTHKIFVSGNGSSLNSSGCESKLKKSIVKLGRQYLGMLDFFVIRPIKNHKYLL